MPGGRPTALTPEVHAKFIEAIRAGAFAVEAAAYVGVAEKTVYRWLERGEAAEERDATSDDPDWEFRQFRQSYTEARGAAKLEAVTVVRQAMRGRIGDQDVPVELQVKTAQWYLERSSPDEWGRNVRLGLSKRSEDPEPDADELAAQGQGIIDELAMRRAG